MTQPRVRHDEGPSTINNSEPAPVSSSEPVSASPPFQRRQSAQDRLDNILETARRRSIALKSSQQQLQPLSPMSLPRAQRDSLNISEERSAEIESSADEHTAIIHRHSRQPQQDYQSTGHSGVRSRNNSANVRRVTPQRTSGDNGRVHDETWWERQLAKYGSIELENKASVARDHLALGKSINAPFQTPQYLSSGFTGHITETRTCRADILSLAANIARIRIHRDSNHTAFPAQRRCNGDRESR